MRRLSLFALVLAAAPMVPAQSKLLSNARVGVGNSAISYLNGLIPGSSSITPTASRYEASGSFDGLDSEGDPRTMDFYGYAESSSAYGRLRTYADGYVLNSFYNPSNPLYYDSRNNSFHPEGTPDLLVAIAYAGFEDTLQFGGQLLSGYKARYVFRVHGTNVDDGDSQIAAATTLAVSIAGDPYEYKNVLDPGSIDEIWSTRSHSVAGSLAQTVKVDLYSQFADQTPFYADGSDIRGTSDFGSTIDLAGVMLVDASGNVVPSSQWTMTSASGTTYARLDAVPEPTTMIPLTVVGLAALRRRRNAHEWTKA